MDYSLRVAIHRGPVYLFNLNLINVMNFTRLKMIFTTFFWIFIALSTAYIIVFGRALSQNENHIGIALAVPRVIVSSKAVRIDDEGYLAYKPEAFIKSMGAQGFIHTERLGSAYFFMKDGKRYIASGRMYSSFFMVFTQPEETAQAAR